MRTKCMFFVLEIYDSLHESSLRCEDDMGID